MVPLTGVGKHMTSGVEYLRTTDTVVDAAKRFAQADIGAVPICGPDVHLAGIGTNNAIVDKTVRRVHDP